MEDRGQRSEIRGQRAEVGDRMTEDGGRISEVGKRGMDIETKQIKSAKDLKVYKKAYALAMEIFNISKRWPATATS